MRSSSLKAQRCSTAKLLDRSVEEHYSRVALYLERRAELGDIPEADMLPAKPDDGLWW